MVHLANGKAQLIKLDAMCMSLVRCWSVYLHSQQLTEMKRIWGWISGAVMLSTLVAQVMLQDGSIQALTPTLRAKATETVNAMSEKALRCLAFAQKTDDLGTMLPCTSHTELPCRPFWCQISVLLSPLHSIRKMLHSIKLVSNTQHILFILYSALHDMCASFP